MSENPSKKDYLSEGKLSVTTKTNHRADPGPASGRDDLAYFGGS